MAKIFIFRHGQTDDNLHKIFSGWRQTDLTEKGVKEAEGIGEKLANEKVTYGYCSDLIRSRHTLELALRPHPGTPVTEDARIKERSYGDLTGTSKTELQEKDPTNYALWHRSYNIAPPGGESIEDVEKRVTLFLEKLMKNLNPEDVIFIAAHGNSIRPMRKFFEHLTNEEMCSYEYTPGQIFSYTV